MSTSALNYSIKFDDRIWRRNWKYIWVSYKLGYHITCCGEALHLPAILLQTVQN